MAKNTYFISVTLLHTVRVEADTPEEALQGRGVHDALFEDGYGDLSVEATTIDDVVEDGPARVKAYEAAVEFSRNTEKLYGRESPEFKAAERVLMDAIAELP